MRQAPLRLLAQVLRQSPENLKSRLENAGFPVGTFTQTLVGLVGLGLKALFGHLNRFLPPR